MLQTDSIPHAPPHTYIDNTCSDWLGASGLRPFTLAGRTLLPIVQGGMGIGVSAHRLAGAVSALGGMGTISSVDLRRHHPDLMEQTRGLPPGPRAKEAIDAVVVGAGLPLDLPDLAQDHPKAALVPILSDARGVQLLVRKWERKKRRPDAIVLEHPRLAGGHLGAAKIADLADPRFDFENAIPQSLAFLRSAGLEAEVPLIAAGGIRSCEDIARVQALGAAAAQLGTPFAVTEEGDAHLEFKRVLAQARDSDMVEFTSVAGLPARAVATPWLRAYLKIEDRLQAVCHAKSRCTKSFDCLAQCGLRDGLAGWGQFCIDSQLAAALRGDVKKGLFFRGAGALPFGDQIRSTRDLVRKLLTPAALPVVT